MNYIKPLLIAVTVVSTVLVPAMVRAPQSKPLQLKQLKDREPARSLTAVEFASLGDPLFLLVLKERADVTNLGILEELIQPDLSKRQVFVVDENIADSRRNQGRRSVLTFTGENQNIILNSNVMLSVFFTSEEFSDTPRQIEAWAWDNSRGRYNYYKMDNTGTPDGRLSWKFRGSSAGADLLSPADRGGTCMACHINGGPVMKELLRPWNNWHSSDSQIVYLQPTAAAAIRWPVATSSRLRGHPLDKAH